MQTDQPNYNSMEGEMPTSYSFRNLKVVKILIYCAAAISFLAVVFLIIIFYPFRGATQSDIQGGAENDAVSWSTLGIVADGITDNTAALNALPTGVDILADCPGGGPIKFDGKWYLQSDLRIFGVAGCTIVSTDAFTRGKDTRDESTSGTIRQKDLFTPLTNVTLVGLHIRKSAPGRLLIGYINGFTFKSNTLDLTSGLGFIRGSDQEFGNNTITISGPTSDSMGIRHMGNMPKAPTTGGKPANVWVHDNVCNGYDDGCYQVAPDGHEWGNNGADDYLFEDNTCVITTPKGGRCILVGMAASYSTSNIIFRHMQLTSSGEAIGVRNPERGGAGLEIRDILFEDIMIDASSSTSKAAISVHPGAEPTIKRVTFDNVTVNGPLGAGLVIGIQKDAGASEDIVFKNGSLGKPRDGSEYTVQVENSKNFTLENSDVYAGNAGAVALGIETDDSVITPVINQNRFFDIPNGAFGILSGRVSAGSFTQNVFHRRDGDHGTSARGVSLAASDKKSDGTSNTIVTGNDLVDILGSSKIICAPDRGNMVKENSGAADCP